MALHSLHAPPPHTCLRVRRMPPCVSASEHSVRRVCMAERAPRRARRALLGLRVFGTHFTRRCYTHCYGSALHATACPRRNAHDVTVYSLRPSMHACALRTAARTRRGRPRAAGWFGSPTDCLGTTDCPGTKDSPECVVLLARRLSPTTRSCRRAQPPSTIGWKR